MFTEKSYGVDAGNDTVKVEEEKLLLGVNADTVIYPRAMVVVEDDATLTFVTMNCGWWLHTVTF